MPHVTHRLLLAIVAFLSLLTLPLPTLAQGEGSIEHKLAQLDAGTFVPTSDRRVASFANLITSISAKTLPQTRTEVADRTVKTWQLLKERGVSEGLLDLMEQLDASIPDPSATAPTKKKRGKKAKGGGSTGPYLNYPEVCAAYLVLRTRGR